MATINQLSAVDQVVSSDQVPIYSSEQGDARKASMATLLAFFASQIRVFESFPMDHGMAMFLKFAKASRKI